MRVIIGLAVFIITYSLFASTAEAQLFNRLKDRAKNAAENKVEQKISNEVEKAAERAVENSWKAIFGDEFGEEGDGINIPFTLSSNAVTEEDYSFTVVTTMEIENIKKNGEKEEPVLMHMHFNEDELYSGTKISGEQMNDAEGEVFIIYDIKNESMVMLMNSDDGKFSFAYDWRQAKQFAEEYAEEENESTETSDDQNEIEEWQHFDKLGTKSIAGMECQGYESVDEDEGVRMEFWVSNDEDFGIQKIMQANSETKQIKGHIPDDYPTGMLMEMIHEDVNTGEKTTMRVTEINRNANINYHMADYPAMTIGQAQ